MANYSTVKSKRINVPACLAELQRINEESFAGQFKIQSESSGSVTLTDSIKSYSFTFWIDGNTIQWKTQSNQELFWYSETFAAKMLRVISPRAKIRNEGIAESIELNFDQQYPTMDSWLNSWTKFL